MKRIKEKIINLKKKVEKVIGIESQSDIIATKTASQLSMIVSGIIDSGYDREMLIAFTNTIGVDCFDNGFEFSFDIEMESTWNFKIRRDRKMIIISSKENCKDFEIEVIERSFYLTEGENDSKIMKVFIPAVTETLVEVNHLYKMA